MDHRVNVADNMGKVVGRRTQPADGLSVVQSNKASSIAWRRAFGGVRIPRGVFRFATHEEADEWMWKMISRPRPN